VIGFIERKKLPMKNPSAMFRIIVQNFVFAPFEKMTKTTAAIQKNARRIATISCL